MIQDHLLTLIQKHIGNKTSIIEAIANVLDISYDAAHRRTSLKSKLSLEESIALAKHFNISLDQLYSIGENNTIIAHKTSSIENEDDLIHYFEHSIKNLNELSKSEPIDLIYLAKDIPIFHTLNNDLLNRFKIYAWFKILNPKLVNKNFNEFRPSPKLILASEKLSKLYSKFNINEIWDTTTINSTLKQIHYYYKSNLIDSSIAIQLCHNLNSCIKSVKQKVIDNKNHNLYYNELLLMNNQVIISGPTQNALFIPYKVLSYIRITDSKSCSETLKYVELLKNQSKLLNHSGEKDIMLFFNKIHTKINALEQLILSENILDFE